MTRILTPKTLSHLGLILWLAGLLLGWAAGGWGSKLSTSPLYWTLIVSGMILLGTSNYLLRLDAKRARQREADFLKDLRGIANDLTMSDPEDRLEDLCLLYDEAERKDILDRLGRMPEGSRKLRVVLEQMETDAGPDEPH
jgi:hypothetical protein